MKQLFTLSSLAFALLLASCGQQAQDQIGASTANINTEAKRNVAADAAKPNDDIAAVARNWKKADTYINLKLDGTFEAALEANSVLAGKWQLSEDEKSLTLQAEKSAEGKGVTQTLTFAVEQISDAGLIIKNEKGERLEFAAQ